jgi:hypothetical protein
MPVRSTTPLAPADLRGQVPLALAAEAYRLNTKTLRRRIATGELRAWRLGQLLYIDAEQLAGLMVPVPTAGGPE